MTLPSIIFNGQINHYTDRIGGVSVRAQLVNGAAYSFASGSELNKLTNDIKVEVFSVYMLHDTRGPGLSMDIMNIYGENASS